MTLSPHQVPHLTLYLSLNFGFELATVLYANQNHKKILLISEIITTESKFYSLGKKHHLKKQGSPRPVYCCSPGFHFSGVFLKKVAVQKPCPDFTQSLIPQCQR